jgi:hypothetical protein
MQSWLARENRRLARALLEAKLRPSHACLEAIDYTARRGLERAQIPQLATCRWVAEHQALIIVGATGTGKSFVACALAHQGCRQGYRALYWWTSRLFHELALARAAGTYPRLLTRLARIDVLVLDDWGLAPVDDQAAAGSTRKSSRIATICGLPLSRASSRPHSGTNTWRTRRWPTRSVTAFSITHIGSSSRVSRCARSVPNPQTGG